MGQPGPDATSGDHRLRRRARAGADVMRALSDPIRVEALIRLATGECCRISVSDLAGQVAVSVSNLSYHLTRLHEAGVLGRSRDHRAVNYWIVRDFLPLIRAVYETSRSRETVRPLRQGV